MKTLIGQSHQNTWASRPKIVIGTRPAVASPATTAIPTVTAARRASRSLARRASHQQSPRITVSATKDTAAVTSEGAVQPFDGRSVWFIDGRNHHGGKARTEATSLVP